MTVRRNTGYLLAVGLVSAFLFGTATPASKSLLYDVQPQALAGLLYLGAAIGVLPVLLRERTFCLPWRAGNRTIALLAGAILLGGVLGPWLLLLGLRRATSGSVSLLLNLELVATVFLGHVIFRDYLTTRGWLAAAGSLLAAVLLALGEGPSGLFSGLLVGAACLCWGFDNHLTALIDGITPAQTTLWKGLVAGIFNLVIGGFVLSGLGSGVTIVLALGVGALSYGLSIVLYITAAQGLGASRSQMVFSTAPFFGLLLSLVILGESLTSLQIIAALIIIGSLVLLFSEHHRHVHRHERMIHEHWHRHDDGHHCHEHDGPAATVHTHRHVHEPVEHEHPHWPDLHHRHDHGDDG